MFQSKQWPFLLKKSEYYCINRSVSIEGVLVDNFSALNRSSLLSQPGNLSLHALFHSFCLMKSSIILPQYLRTENKLQIYFKHITTFLILIKYGRIKMVALSNKYVLLYYIYCQCCHMYLISLFTGVQQNQVMRESLLMDLCYSVNLYKPLQNWLLQKPLQTGTNRYKPDTPQTVINR